MAKEEWLIVKRFAFKEKSLAYAQKSDNSKRLIFCCGRHLIGVDFESAEEAQEWFSRIGGESGACREAGPTIFRTSRFTIVSDYVDAYIRRKNAEGAQEVVIFMSVGPEAVIVDTLIGDDVS